MNKLGLIALKVAHDKAVDLEVLTTEPIRGCTHDSPSPKVDAYDVKDAAIEIREIIDAVMESLEQTK